MSSFVRKPAIPAPLEVPSALCASVSATTQSGKFFVVAIDGPAAAGKGTIAKMLAAHFGLGYLDSGKIYRALALRADANGVEPDDAQGIERIAEALHYDDFSRLENSSGKAGRLAAKYASSGRVRRLAVSIQRRIAAEVSSNKWGIVIDGRDIGTIVFPDASVKIYVTASSEARANRRHEDFLARGESPSLVEVRRDLDDRDRRDSTRAIAPMRPAADAVLLDTTDLGIDEAFDAARRIVEAARGAGPG